MLRCLPLLVVGTDPALTDKALDGRPGDCSVDKETVSMCDACEVRNYEDSLGFDVLHFCIVHRLCLDLCYEITVETSLVQNIHD